jgi:hypothetical protein
LPISKKTLQSFLGQTNVFHRFIPNYAEIVKPIYKFLKKDVKFEWNDESKKAFQEIKTAISEALILISPDYSKDFQIFSFASKDTIVGVLLQKNDQGHDQPIAYMSRALQNAELKYPTFEKQAYCYPRYLGITRRSCLEAHMVLDMEYREQERLEHGPGGPIFLLLSQTCPVSSTSFHHYRPGLASERTLAP